MSLRYKLLQTRGKVFTKVFLCSSQHYCDFQPLESSVVLVFTGRLAANVFFYFGLLGAFALSKFPWTLIKQSDPALCRWELQPLRRSRGIWLTGALLPLLFLLLPGLADTTHDAGREEQEQRRQEQGQKTESHQGPHHLQHDMEKYWIQFLLWIELDEIIESNMKGYFIHRKKNHPFKAVGVTDDHRV